MPTPFHERVREARLARHLSQQKLALAVGIGVTQPAISLLERGNMGVLSQDGIERIADYLGLQVASAPSAGASQTGQTDVLAYCANPDCPRAYCSVVSGKLRIRPSMSMVRSGLDTVYCKDCGEPLQSGCLHCMTPLVENAVFCLGCGHPLVLDSRPMIIDDLVEHAETMNRLRQAYCDAESPVTKAPVPQLHNAGRGLKNEHHPGGVT